MTRTDPDTSPHGPEVVAAPIVDWRRTARRLRRQLLVIAGLVVAAWLVIGLAGTGLTLRLFAEVAGFGLFLAFLAEVVVVGGSAVRGLLRAGERGDRLASADVTLLPPQLRGRRRNG
ncbi:MAG: hypothetical protein WD378_00325 [Egicoccus sp.]